MDRVIGIGCYRCKGATEHYIDNGYTKCVPCGNVNGYTIQKKLTLNKILGINQTKAQD